MKKYIITIFTIGLTLVACNKWTETESNTEKFENIALDNLREVRDGIKWQTEAEQTEEAKKALDVYWQQLREYKDKAWLNTGENGGQKPMFYYWYAGTMWRAEDGLPRTWLQSIPDSITCISLWGGLAIRPTQLTENMKKDLEIFHKKGSKVLTCYQVSAVGLGLPGGKNAEGKDISGWEYFRQKYPCDTDYDKWPEIYAREIARHIIALGLDGFDIDWEPACGDHGSDRNRCGHNFVRQDAGEHMDRFIKEIGKYFGPVGNNHLVKNQTDREANIKTLFEASTAGYHSNEKVFIDEFKPHLPSDYATKRYYLCADVPCGAYLSEIFTETGLFEIYFDKHFVQDYGNGVSTGRFIPSGKAEYNSTGAEYERGQWNTLPSKAKAIKERRVWGFAGYHGEMDYENSYESANYKNSWKFPAKYKNYACTRALIRESDPRPTYANTKELDVIIIKP